MKKSEAKPGVRIIASLVYPDNYGYEPAYVWYYTPNTYSEYVLTGVILDKEAEQDGCVVVQWDEGCDRDEEEEEIEIEILGLESNKSDLEKEFKAVEKKISAKMKEAAKLVREANEMAQAAGAPHLESMDASYQLVSAMDDSGWRSSSWGC